MRNRLNKFFSLLASFSLLFNSFSTPLYAYAEENGILETPIIEESLNPSESPIPLQESVPTLEPTPATPASTETLLQPDLEEPQEENSSAEIATSYWQENSDGSVTTINPVGEGIEYKYKDTQVKVVFTKLANPGYLTIKEIKLSEEQKEELGAIGDTAYDISSDMQDGTFLYDLTLPNPDTTKDIQVKYSEDGNTFQDLDSESTNNILVIKNLNHFTVFITVVNPTPPPTSYQEGVIDDGDVEYSEVGTWSNATTCAPNAYGADGRWADSTGSKTATWQINVPQTGHYKVYFSWVRHVNRASNANYTVSYEGGSESFFVDQRGTNCEWSDFVLHGNYLFNAGINYSVVLSNSGIAAGQYVFADAIKIVGGDDIAPETPTLISPVNNAYLTGASLTNLWSEVGDAAKYIYESYHDSLATNLRWNQEILAPAHSKTATNVVDTIFWWRVKAVDALGNESSWSELRKVTVDNISPDVEITSPMDSYVSGVVPIRGTVTDVNPHHYWLVIQNSSNHTVAGPGTVNDTSSFTNKLFFNWDTQLVPDGTYTIKLEARDAAGNKDSGSVDWNTVIVDNSEPVIFSQTTFSGWYPTDQISNFEYSDPGSGIVSGTPVSCTINTEGTDQTCSITPNVCDALGNCNTTLVISHPANIDKSVPSVPGIPFTFTPTTSLNQTWSWDPSMDVVSDILQYLWRIPDYGNSNVLGTSVDTNLSDGIWDFFVKAQDLAGNESGESSGSVTVDTTSPENPTIISSSHTSEVWSSDRTIGITWSSADSLTGVAGYSWKWDQLSGTIPDEVIDGNVTSNTSSNRPTSQSIWFHIRAVDGVGNWSGTTHYGPFWIDAANPQVAWTNPLNGDHVGGLVNLQATASDVGSGMDFVRFRIMPVGGSFSTLTEDSSEPYETVLDTTGFDDGEYVLRARAFDLTGRSSSLASSDITVTIDNTAPTSIIDTPTPDSYFNGLINISGVSTDGVDAHTVSYTDLYYRVHGESEWTYLVTLNNSEWTEPLNWSYDWVPPLEGVYDFMAVATDDAGNIEAEGPVVENVTYDITSPTGSWISPIDGSTVSGLVHLEFNASDVLSGVDEVRFQYKRDDDVDDFHDITGSDWDTAGLDLDTYVLRAVVSDLAGNSDNFDESVDIAAVVSNESGVGTSTTTATITWTTDRPTSSRVVYDIISHSLGTAPNYGYAFSTGTFNTDPKVLSHSVTIEGLTPGTVYYYRTISAGSPTAVVAENTFATLSQAGAPAPGPWSGQVAGISTVAPSSLGGNYSLASEVVEETTTEEITQTGEENKEVLGEGTEAKEFNKNWIWIIVIALSSFIGFIYLRKRTKKS